MASAKDILLLGDPRLYEACEPVKSSEIGQLADWTDQLRSAMQDVQRIYGFGRGIAAPQLGIMKRLVFISMDQEYIMVNPEIGFQSEEVFEMWDDCMSFPNLLVKVSRNKTVEVNYKNELWEDKTLRVSNDFSELLQHEIDHLDGILCTMRAIDLKSFKWKTKAE